MKVSIIIPTLDGDRDGLTQQTIASCQCQDGFILGMDYEVILQQGDELVGKNINNGVAKAKGKYIKICADDDLLTSNCLKDLYEKAEEGYDLVCSDAVNFEEDGSEDYYPSDIPETVSDFATENTIHGGTILYRKYAMPAWDETMHTAEEYELNLRMAAAGCKFGYIPKVTYRYRLHGEQKSISGNKFSRSEYITHIQGRFINNHNRINGYVLLGDTALK